MKRLIIFLKSAHTHTHVYQKHSQPLTRLERKFKQENTQ